MKPINFLKELPPIEIDYVTPIRSHRGSDSYGALKVAAKYCSIKYKNWLLNFTWHHGCMPPWQNVHPIAISYGVDKNEKIFVARKDQMLFLRANGYNNVETIGLPICYVESINPPRLPNSLLIMPPHVHPNQNLEGNNFFKEYSDYIHSIMKDFDCVVACINNQCLEKGYWIQEFKNLGIPIQKGAHRLDRNALLRQKFLFQKFETMTTTNYGSHIPYALASNCKVSISGPSMKMCISQILKDDTWAKIPDIAHKLFIEDEFGLNTVPELMKFKSKPTNAISDIEYGEFLIGKKNMLESKALKKQFHWDGIQKLVPFSTNLRHKVHLRTRVKDFLFPK